MGQRQRVKQFGFNQTLLGWTEAKVACDVVQRLAKGCDLIAGIHNLTNNGPVLCGFVAHTHPELPSQTQRHGEEQRNGEDSCSPKQAFEVRSRHLSQPVHPLRVVQRNGGEDP